MQEGQGVPPGSHFKKLGEFSRDDSLLEYSTHERSPPMQGNPEMKNSAELRHPNHVIEPDQVSQVRGQKNPAMGYNSPAFQAEINEKYTTKTSWILNRKIILVPLVSLCSTCQREKV